MVTNTYAHIDGHRPTRGSVRAVKRAALFLFVSVTMTRALVACGERCQINDPRSECNAYGAPDKYKDANIVVDESDAAAD